MLVVKPTGAPSWVLRYQLNGRRRDMGLGSYPDVSLARARETARDARRLLADRVDPLTIRPAPTMTFRDAADALIASKRAGWRNAKHVAEWMSTLTRYACPALGDLQVGTIDTPHVLGILRPIWNEKPETASRLRQRIEAVLDYAAVQGARSGPNPARWRGHLETVLPAPSKVRSVAHHAALDWRDLPEFMDRLSARAGASARALEFLILTAARSGEVRGMRWGEVDLEAGLWTVPAARMKAAKEHRVPTTLKEAGRSTRRLEAVSNLDRRLPRQLMSALSRLAVHAEPLRIAGSRLCYAQSRAAASRRAAIER